MAYITRDLNKIIKNPSVRKSIEKSKQVIFLPAFVITLVSFLVLAGIFYGATNNPHMALIISGAMSLFSGYYTYTSSLYSWIKKNVNQNIEHRDGWIQEVKRVYFSNRLIPKNNYLKKSLSLLSETKQGIQTKHIESTNNYSPLNFGDKLIIRKSKKISIIILVCCVLIFTLFTNDYLFSIFKDGLEVRRSGSLQRFWYPVEYFLGILIILGGYQIINFFKIQRKILEISRDGILYKDYLYRWSDIKNEEVTFGKRNRVYSRGIISHYLVFSHHGEKIYIKLSSLDKSPKKIASALWFYRDKIYKQDY